MGNSDAILVLDSHLLRGMVKINQHAEEERRDKKETSRFDMGWESSLKINAGKALSLGVNEVIHQAH